jgi:hypothetical protein
MRLEPKGWQPSFQCLCFHRVPARSSSSTLSVRKRINQSQPSPFFTRRRKCCASICTLLAMSGSWSFSNMISLAAISAASLDLKPRITNPLARLMKLSGAKGAVGWCVAQSCLWNLDEASLSYAFFASGSSRSDGRGNAQPHREQVQPVRRWSNTQVSALAITLYDPRGIIGR